MATRQCIKASLALAIERSHERGDLGAIEHAISRRLRGWLLDLNERVRLNEAATDSPKSASKDVKSAMERRKAGTLKSGKSGKTVKSKKQAIAIGLSEARAKGKKVPNKKSS
jgi:hypothetical protein